MRVGTKPRKNRFPRAPQNPGTAFPRGALYRLFSLGACSAQRAAERRHVRMHSWVQIPAPARFKNAGVAERSKA